MHKLSRTAIVAAVLIAGVGCQDLDVPNMNNPSLDEAKKNPTNMETAAGTAFKYMFTVMQASDIRNGTTLYPSMAFAGMGNEVTSGDNTGRFSDCCLEPRPEFNNFDQGQWINRTPYQMIYGGIATAKDVLESINSGIKIGASTSDRPRGLHTDRAEWWSTFMVGLGHIYLGMIFDKSLIIELDKPIDENNKNFRPYTEVLAKGIEQTRAAIALATKAPEDTTPDTWVNGIKIPKADAIRIMHSMIARAMVYGARTPEERAKVDWNAVITELDAGIVKNFQQQAVNTNSGTISYYKQQVQLGTNARPAVRLYGPADTTGAYQAWLAKPVEQRAAISIATPDKRISNVDLQKNGGVVTGGAYIQFISAQAMSASLGTYLLSNYRGVRYGFGTTNNFYQTGLIDLMTLTEMDFIRAEALYRLNRRAEAVTLINKTRVANGKLPPVDVNGPPQATAAQKAACVPRRDDGSCGDLFDALMWESRIENFGIEATIAWANARGWGKLLPGTMIHLPIPGRELQTLELPYYTFGGLGKPGTAP